MVKIQANSVKFFEYKYNHCYILFIWFHLYIRYYLAERLTLLIFQIILLFCLDTTPQV